MKLPDITNKITNNYMNASPFEHAVFDGVFDDKELENVIKEIPKEKKLHLMRNKYENKWFNSDPSDWGSTTKSLMDELNSDEFVSWLSSLTGIEDLVADPTFRGGGIHYMKRGGYLNTHVDFNQNLSGLYRRLNVLIFLNKEWKDHYFGHLKLGIPGSETEKSISPLFNRMVVFTTSEDSFHGVPDIINCPPDQARISLALYYYTKEKSPVFKKMHGTVFAY